MNTNQSQQAFLNGKVAFVTDDGTTISSHFGRAQYYEIITITNGTVTSRTCIPKDGHHTFGKSEDDHHNQNHRHRQMTESIRDCAILVARGMGRGAFEHLTSEGIDVILTDLKTIDEAVSALIAGTLQSNEKRLHEGGGAYHHH